MNIDRAAKLMVLGALTLLVAAASAARLLYVLSGSTDVPDASSTAITIVQVGVTSVLAVVLLALGAQARIASRRESSRLS